MQTITFVTGNQDKFAVAQQVFANAGLILTQSVHDIDEIQGEDSKLIAKDKLQKAYDKAGGPVVVNDDSWALAGLGGFPGPYLKSIVHWLNSADLLRLTAPLRDRRVILTQWIGYQDSTQQKLLSFEYTGEILQMAKGSYGNALQKIITMPGDKGKTVSEQYDAGIDVSQREVAHGWLQFANWYKAQQL